MKTIRRLLFLFTLVAAAGCQAGPTAPLTARAEAARAAVAEASGAASAAPTSVPAADLSAGYASFPGLYWTGEQITSGAAGSVRVLSARPCAELLDLLSAGEWRATARLDSPPSLIRWPSLLRLERGEAVALARADSLQPVTTTITTEASPLAPGEQCRAHVTQLSTQPVAAAGAESATGQAHVYPYVGGCRTLQAGTQIAQDVMLLYEGPGDFRAVLAMELSGPVAEGERALEPHGLTLTVFRSEQTYFEVMGEAYAQILEGVEPNPQAMAAARSFSAASQTPGTLTVTGTNPLEGQVDLTHLADDAGESQSFRAGFRCNG